MIQHKYDGSLYQSILDEMRSDVRNLRPGVRLPSENAMCRKYNIARMTAGKVLNQLAEEDMIERHRGRGSFVKGERVVTFLLPMLEFVADTNYQSGISTQLRMRGAMRAARERGIRFEPLAVAPENNRDDLRYSLLSHLHAGSMVILTYWFCRLFKQLHDKNAGVALLDEQEIRYGYEQYTRNWTRQIVDRKNGTIKALNYLYAHGCRRILLAGQYVRNPLHPVALGYRQWIKEHPQPELTIPLPQTVEAMHREGTGLAEYHRRNHFDGILLCTDPLNPGRTIQEALGVPESVQALGFNFNPEQFPLLAPFPCFILPHEQIGYDAVSILADAPACRVRRYYDYTLINSN